MRSPQRGIGCGVIRVEIDGALKERGRFVVFLAACMRKEFATAQTEFVGREICSGLGEHTLPLKTRQRYRSRTYNATGNVVLHGKDVLALGIVGFRPDMNPRRG